MASVKDFSVEEKLKSLVRLQKIDGKLGEIQILKGELPIEVKDLEDEIEGLHARQLRVEEEINGMQEFIAQKKEAIKDATEEISDKARQLESAKKAVSTKEGNLSGKKSELEKIIAETEKEEKQYDKQAADARSHVEERILISYDRIRKSYRNGLAVVPVERDSCGGCFHAIPPQRQSEIKLRKKVIVCENCGRILVDNDLNDTVEVK